MSAIDPTTRAGPQVPPAADVQGAGSEAPRRQPTTRAGPTKGDEEPNRAKQVLDAVAAKALAHPPQNVAELSASAMKFLLTDLEPALRLARQLREQVATRDESFTRQVIADDRREETLALLAAETHSATT
jgi:hypothetical protein